MPEKALSQSPKSVVTNGPATPANSAPLRVLEAWLASDPDFRGIGTARARALTEAFGLDLHRALSERDPRAIDLLGAEVALNAFEVYEWRDAEVELILFFEKVGLADQVDPRALTRISRAWGRCGAKRIIENPYLLVSILPWSDVDRVGRALGIDKEDPRRLAAAGEAALYAHLEKNHTWTSEAEAAVSAAHLLDSSPELGERALREACLAGGAVPFDGGYQPPGAAEMEAVIANEIRRMAEEGPVRDLYSVSFGPDDVDLGLEAFEKGRPWALTGPQREAVRMALCSRVMMLGGYAGSGKTAVLHAICDLAESFGLQPKLMALSGRAAQRMTASTGRRATTIASFLLEVTGQPALDAGTLVVIDEASMVDLPTFWRIVRQLGDARLVMVGDPAQLPPIGFGLVFHALIDAPCVPRVVLDQVMRQSEASGIPAVAAAIREGVMPKLPAFGGRRDGVSLVPCRPEMAIEHILSVGRTLSAEGVERGEVQIIAPMRRGPAGIDAINRALHARHVARLPGVRCFPGRPDISEGEPIIWTKNDWDRGLMNGSMGRLLSVFPGGAVADLDGREIHLTSTDADKIDLSYAISVHKAQGSQWGRVIVSFAPSMLLDQPLLYTAITRALTQVIMIGGSFEAGKQISGKSRQKCPSTALCKRLQD